MGRALEDVLVLDLGQIYNGQILKGLVFLCISLINLMLMWVLIGFITTPLFWIYAIYDGYRTAEHVNAERGGTAPF